MVTRSERAEPGLAGAQIRELLRSAAGRLGAADPTEVMGDVLATAFPAAADSGYLGNALLPGATPCELAFSETEPGVLRFTFEPGGPTLEPAARRIAARETADRLARRAWPGRRHPFADQWVARGEPPGPPAPVFGGFVGAAFGPRGLTGVRLYTEIAPEHGPAGPAGDAARAAGLQPWMHAMDIDGDRALERHYLVNRCHDIRLADVAGIARAAGLADRSPGLLVTLLHLSGGRSTLPPGTFALGIRARPDGTELKCELLLGGNGPPDMARTVAHLLGERPDGYAAYRAWLAAVAPLSMSVVSARIAPRHGVRLNVYGYRRT